MMLTNISPDHDKSHDPDNLPACFLKEISSESVPTLILIFQASLDQGTLLVVWNQAIYS